MDADRVKQQKAGIGNMFSSASETYDQVGPQFFKPLGKRLVELAEIPVGATVLDVAAGRGAVLFPAAERVGAAGRVIGIDLAEGMVQQTNAEIQRRGLTNVEMRQMDAEQLDFPDETFDVVFCGFGIFFFPQRDKALAEFRRVLKTGGTLALTTWGRDDEDWSWMREVQHKYRSPGEPLPPAGPNPYNNVEGLTKILQDANFQQIQITGEDPDFVYVDEDAWWAVQWSHVGRGLLQSLSDETREQYKAESFEKMQASKKADGIHQRFSTIYSLAKKGS